MGVLACAREACENVMCRRLILHRRAYLCDDCYEELLAYKQTWPTTMPACEVRERIEAFLDTEPGTYLNLHAGEIDAEFARLTGD